jgi:hypothetical protein
METFQEEVKRVEEAHKILEEVLNPQEFVTIAREVFPGNTQTRQLLEKFTKYEWTYQTIGPDDAKCPRHMWETAGNLLNRTVSLDLKVVVLLPNHLVHTKTFKQIRPALRWHGGGGVSCPFSSFSHATNVPGDWRTHVRRLDVSGGPRIYPPPEYDKH